MLTVFEFLYFESHLVIKCQNIFHKKSVFIWDKSLSVFHIRNDPIFYVISLLKRTRNQLNGRLVQLTLIEKKPSDSDFSVVKWLSTT